MASSWPFTVLRRRGTVTVVLIVTLKCLLQPSDAADVAFRRHVVNAESEYSAVAVLDANHDGLQDILCGGFWYEAPTWRSHFVRNVERIRGRFDGYSHLPLDVNGDGWTDIITVNYRSSSIRWLEHPGKDLGEWPMHTVEEPGPMETGRLFDINGDGRLDVLANGQNFAAWWEIEPRWSDNTARVAPKWTRHELPQEAGGHGLGFGDIDGDGRGDVLGPLGWAQAPEHRENQRWVWHREFHLGRASIPVLVVDVDEDGDSDLVWTRAHGFGIYWWEQTKDANNARQWVHHTIDASWSQCHSPLWADLDGDGRNELVAGKRYMAHEGADPGAYDPLVAYRYQFDPVSRTWNRWPISENEHVGFGLDPKVADLDDDGDLDLVVCGRSGLYWLENTGLPKVARSNQPTPPYDDHAGLMVVKDGDGSERPVETPFDWGLRRSHIIASIQEAWGQLPSPHDRVPLDTRFFEREQIDACTRQRVSFQVAAGRHVNAELWLPQSTESGAPAIVCVQPSGVSAGANGNAASGAPSSLAPSSLAHIVAQELAGKGYVCIVPEMSTETPAMTSVWTCIRAADVLESLPQVNAEGLGCVGLGAGANLSVLAAAFEQRFVATLSSGDLSSAGPSWPKASFSFAEVLGSIAPRTISLRPARNAAEQQMKAITRDVSQVADVFGLNPRAQAPAIGGVSFDVADGPTRAEAYEWLDGTLMRSRFSRRPNAQ